MYSNLILNALRTGYRAPKFKKMNKKKCDLVIAKIIKSVQMELFFDCDENRFKLDTLR